MTTAEYAAKYGLSTRAVYWAIYSGRLHGKRGPSGWDLDDAPPSVSDRWRAPEELTSLPDYILALIWYNATTSRDAILIRNTDPYVSRTVAEYLRGSVWESKRNAKTPTCIFKAHSPALAQALREIGFSGRSDSDRMAPPVDPLLAAQAFTETHGSLLFALRYSRRDSLDKQYAYYVPRLDVSGAVAIVQSYVDTLHGMGIIPRRRLSPAANETSREISFTSQKQLIGIGNALSASTPRHDVFWSRYFAHIAQTPISYMDYHKRSNNDRY